MCGSELEVHDEVPKLAKWRALEGLGEKVSQHFSGGAVLNVHLFVSDTVSHKEISNVDVSRPLAA
jgi:hypothetical protein